MHIVYVSREYPPSMRMGGIASYAKETAECVARMGHKVTVVCASDDTREQSDEMQNGVRIIRLSGGDFIVPSVESTSLMRLKRLRMFYRFYSYRRKVRDVVKSLPDVDVVEVAEYGAEAYYLNKLDVPVVVRLHTPTLLKRADFTMMRFSLRRFHEYWLGRQELKTIRQARYMTSCSESLRRWVDRYVPDKKAEIQVIYNGINTDKWQPVAHVDSGINVVYAGTVAAPKGVGDLIEACRILREQGMDVHLSLAGKLGDYGEEQRKLCEARGYGWCRFQGHIDREQLTELYRHAKAVCFPSWWDNLPMVCLEAMATGNVVIGSDSGGMAEIIEDGVSGFLVQPHSPVALSDVLRRVLTFPIEKRETIAEAARYRIAEMFSTSNVIPQTISYFEKLSRK